LIQIELTITKRRFDMDNFNGKVAVITGAGRGIGRGIALRCGKEGMQVVLAGSNLNSLQNTETELKNKGASTLIVRTDVSKRGEVENLLAETLRVFGKVHLLVNNAGVGVIYKSVLESNYTDWDWVMGVNFNGVLYGVKTFLPTMIQQSEECYIVNISSLNGIVAGEPMFASYSASKQAVVGLTEALFSELAKSAPHVHLSVYCPGQVRTNLAESERNYPTDAADKLQITPERQVGIEGLKKDLSVGIPIDKAADILFAGLRENKLYIGPLGFLEQFPDLPTWIRARSENIINENNPIL
jgi:NAD(P)-dependent dehydrogenase (short-subunit alcohol dehydrogenase family)